MSMSRIDRLPPELIVRLLTCIRTPQDLLSLITTTQYFNATFQQNRLTILSAVVRNGIPEKNLYIAIATCKAAHISRASIAQYSVEDCAQNQAEFYQDNPGGVAPRSCSLRDEKLLISLYKLWNITDSFMKSFQLYACRHIARRKSWIKQPECFRDLSIEEKIKLQRAFFRFEMHRRLISARLIRRFRTDNQAENLQSSTFFKLFPPCEREEILSIEHFLVEYAKDVVRDSIDFLVDTVLSIIRVKSAIPGTVFVRDPLESLATCLDFNSIDIFDQDRAFPGERFLYLAGRGLPFLRWLQGLEPKAKLDFLSKAAFEECARTAYRILQTHEFDLGRNGGQHPCSSGLCTTDHAQDGWRWAQKHGLVHHRDGIEMRYELRRMGYVFWDVSRLIEEWDLFNASPETLDLTRPSSIREEGEWGLPGSKERFDERFRGVHVPEEILGSYEGGILDSLELSEAWYDMMPGGYPMPFSDEEAKLFNIDY